jgi:hypothetical protein
MVHLDNNAVEPVQRLACDAICAEHKVLVQGVSLGSMTEGSVMGLHQAAMAAIRKEQFKLRSPLQCKHHSQSSQVRFTHMPYICMVFRSQIPSESCCCCCAV